MKDNCILTAESVTEGHPDKLCDTIADAVVDACLTQDAAARVACEVMATAGKIIAAGEITAAKVPDIPAIICRTVREAEYGGSDYEVEVITHEQSPDIAEAVCGGTETGAGDQGILYGFACDETKVQLLGFGTFEVKERAARTGKNPATGATIEIPASKAPAFKPGKAFKDSVQ